MSHTTRPQRPGETEGVNYFFITTEAFHEMRNAGAFFESAEVFGHYYGTSLNQLESRLAEGADVILEIDWQGERNRFGNSCQTVPGFSYCPRPLKR